MVISLVQQQQKTQADYNNYLQLFRVKQQMSYRRCTSKYCFIIQRKYRRLRSQSVAERAERC